MNGWLYNVFIDEEVSIGMKNSRDLGHIIDNYIGEVKQLLGKDFLRACVYGSYARGEYSDANKSDIDIAIFTNRPAKEFYYLIDQISEATFEYNVKHDIILSPVFQNENDFNRMLKVLPYYQSIQREGIEVG